MFQLPVINDSEFAAIAVKVNSAQSLTDVEQIQWDRYVSAQLDIRAQLFDLHTNDLVSGDLWSYWDYAFSQGWNSGHEGIWQENRFGYHAVFRRTSTRASSRRAGAA